MPQGNDEPHKCVSGLLQQACRAGASPESRNVVGAYADLLVAKKLGGQLAPPNTKSYDVIVRRKRIQVKARVVANQRNRGDRQVGVVRSWDFDWLLVVLFDEQGNVWKAARFPVAFVQARATPADWERGFRFVATDPVLAAGTNMTAKLRGPISAVANRPSSRGLLASQP